MNLRFFQTQGKMGGGGECKEQGHIVNRWKAKNKWGPEITSKKKIFFLKTVSKGYRFRVYRFLWDSYDLGTL